jgi:DNA-binding CsgD family transcriptional regulator
VETRISLDLIQQWINVRRGDMLSPEIKDHLRKYMQDAVFHREIYFIAELFAERAWLQGDLAQCRAEAEGLFKIAIDINIPFYVGRLGYWMWRAGAITEPPPNAAEPYATQIRGDWRGAASMWEKYGCPYEQAMSLMDGDEAAQLKALEIFEGLDARPIIEKLKMQMSAQGIRIPRGPRPATRENRFGLTSREMEVLEYLVKRQSNNAIAEQLSLSIRTVEHHVASILRKMEAGSRNEAALLAIQESLFLPE